MNNNIDIGTKIIFAFSFLLPIIMIFLTGLVLPFFQKDNIFFGVKIPKEITKRKDMIFLKNYYKKLHILICGTFSIISCFLIFKHYDNTEIMLTCTLILIGLIHLNYYILYKKVKIIKSKENWAAGKKRLIVLDTKLNEDEKTIISKKHFVIPFIIIVLNILVIIMKFPHLPEIIPTHYDILGNVNRWSKKSLISMMFIPISELVLTIFTYFMYILIMNAKKQLKVSKKQFFKEQNLKLQRLWSLSIIADSLLLNILFFNISLSMLQIISIKYVLFLGIIISLVIIIGNIYLGVYTKKSDCKLKVKDCESQEEAVDVVIDRDDDKYWLMGFIYYNPEDPLLWIEKRVGIGWTVNCANPFAKLIVLSLIIFIIWIFYQLI